MMRAVYVKTLEEDLMELDKKGYELFDALTGVLNVLNDREVSPETVLLMKGVVNSLSEALRRIYDAELRLDIVRERLEDREEE